MKNIFDTLIEYGTNEKLDATLYQNEEFHSIENKIADIRKKYSELNLAENDKKIIDKMLDLYAESQAFHVSVAYAQGMKDCAEILKKIELI